jgi:hypothetical protein
MSHKPRPYPARVIDSAITDGVRVVRIRRQCETLLLLLMTQQRCSMEDIVEALWPNPDDQPDWWGQVIRIAVGDLRSALAEFGWRIDCEHNVGYTLNPDADLIKLCYRHANAPLESVETTGQCGNHGCSLRHDHAVQTGKYIAHDCRPNPRRYVAGPSSARQ